jgi:hypothetical protein
MDSPPTIVPTTWMWVAWLVYYSLHLPLWKRKGFSKSKAVSWYHGHLDAFSGVCQSPFGCYWVLLIFNTAPLNKETGAVAMADLIRLKMTGISMLCLEEEANNQQIVPGSRWLNSVCSPIPMAPRFVAEIVGGPSASRRRREDGINKGDWYLMRDHCCQPGIRWIHATGLKCNQPSIAM